MRLSVRNGARWVPVLESAPERGTGLRLDTLSGGWSSRDNRLRMFGHRSDVSITTDISLGRKPGHVRVVTRVRSLPGRVEAVTGRWRFLAGAPDAVWTPNLTPEPDQVIGQHAFAGRHSV